MTAIRGDLPATDRPGSAFIRSTISCSRFPTWRRRNGSIRISGSTCTPPATRSGCKTAGHDHRWGGGGGQAQEAASSLVRLLRRRPALSAGARGSERRRARRPAARVSRATASGSGSGRPADRDQGRGQGVAGPQDDRDLVVVAGRRGGRAGAGQGADRASAPAVARAGVHPRRAIARSRSTRTSRPAALRPFRPRRLHARHPRQRPSHPGVRAIVAGPGCTTAAGT